MPNMAWVVHLVRANAQARDAHGGGEVARAKDDGLEAWTCEGGLIHIDQPLSVLYLSLDANTRLDAHVLFDLCEHRINEVYVLWAANLRHHYRIDILTGSFHDLNDVSIGKLGVQPIDSNADYFARPVKLLEGSHDEGPGELLLGRSNGVLQVQEYLIGIGVRRAHHHLVAGTGNRQLGATQSHGSLSCNSLGAGGKGLAPPATS